MNTRSVDRTDDPAQRAAYWPIPLVRAVPAAITAVVITFSLDHSAELGLLAFGLFAGISGALVAITAAARLRGTPSRSYLIAQGAVSVLAGVLAFVARETNVGAIFVLVITWAVLTGGLELYSGVRARRRHVAAVDWMTTGGLTLAFGVAFAFIPPDFTLAFSGEEEGVSGVLDAAVVAVGLLGAYAAIIAVYLVIAGLSAKWGTDTAPGATNGAEQGANAVKGETL
ncbi:hypothetical protein [Marisediminicola sp. LYQ85]|uniref:hypothetical protein n=1 Tax=Marisediminicola sp. LYQ85 TaxID=3391062 RepID=UPI003982DE3F